MATSKTYRISITLSLVFCMNILKVYVKSHDMVALRCGLPSSQVDFKSSNKRLGVILLKNTATSIIVRLLKMKRFVSEVGFEPTPT